MVALTTTSAAGEFFLTATGTSAVTSVTIAAGASSASVYYEDTKAGTPTVAAADSALTSSLTQVESVSPAAAAMLLIETEPSPTATAGMAFATQPVVRELDQYGNLETGDNSTVVRASLRAERDRYRA